MRRLQVLVISILLPILGAAQYNIVKFDTEATEINGYTIMDSDFNFVSFYSQKPPDSLLYTRYLLKFNNDGDTLFSRQFLKEDTVVRIVNIIQCNINPIEYFMYGMGYKKGDDPRNSFSIFYKIDVSFEVIWERVYCLRPNVFALYDSYPNLLQKKDGGYVFATNYGGDNHLILFEMSSLGDSINYRHYGSDSAGMSLTDFLYNFDSSAYLALTYDAHSDGSGRMAQAITIDTAFNQIKVDYLPLYFDNIVVAKVAPDGNYIAGGGYFGISYPVRESSMAVYKLDTAFNYIANSFVGNPDFDIRKDAGFVSMDFYYPDAIYVAGTFDFDIGTWIPHPSWIVIGKVDNNMNLLTEKYLGGDAYYEFRTITATNDGGAFIGALRYDYLTQDYEHDAYYYRFDSLELTVGMDERSEDNILMNAIVYPNPASDGFFIRTSCIGADLMLYSLQGDMMFKQKITGLITKIEPTGLSSGVYLWKVMTGNIPIESGKILITK